MSTGLFANTCLVWVLGLLIAADLRTVPGCYEMRDSRPYADCPHEAVLKAAGAGDEAAAIEVIARLGAGSVSGEDAAALASVALARQPEVGPQNAGAWTRLLAALHQRDLLSVEQEMAFCDHVVVVDANVGGPVRQGENISVQITCTMYGAPGLDLWVRVIPVELQAAKTAGALDLELINYTSLSTVRQVIGMDSAVLGTTFAPPPGMYAGKCLIRKFYYDDQGMQQLFDRLNKLQHMLEEESFEFSLDYFREHGLMMPHLTFEQLPDEAKALWPAIAAQWKLVTAEPLFVLERVIDVPFEVVAAVDEAELVAPGPDCTSEQLTIGRRGIVLEPPFDVSEAKSADSKIAAVHRVGPRCVELIGREEGITEVLVMSSAGSTHVYEVTVKASVPPAPGPNLIRLASAGQTTVDVGVAVRQVQVIHAKVAEIQSTSPTTVAIKGLEAGETQVWIWTADQRLLIYDVIVTE